MTLFDFVKLRAAPTTTISNPFLNDPDRNFQLFVKDPFTPTIELEPKGVRCGRSSLLLLTEPSDTVELTVWNSAKADITVRSRVGGGTWTMDHRDIPNAPDVQRLTFHHGGIRQIDLTSSGELFLQAMAFSSEDGAAALTGLVSATGRRFDPKAAVLYGQFVKAAYTMYRADPGNLTPSQSADFPTGYRLAAWVQMRDFVIGSTGPVFYGFIAQSMADANHFVLAIRGTSNGIEWWDDLNALYMTTFKVPGCGSVGAGFARIYDTLEVVERPTGAPMAAAAQSLRAAGGFSQQLSSLVRRHAAASAQTAGFAASATVEVTGHSLGAALATLYALENARTDQVSNRALCTFASPYVGDQTFAAVFNGLGLTSWRIVNLPDIVPNLPPAILGFTHVGNEQVLNSTGKVQSSVSCWHSLATYLSLIDSTLQPDPGCRLTATAAVLPHAGPLPGAATPQLVPPG
jgi:triacylglycerol lipase